MSFPFLSSLRICTDVTGAEIGLCTEDKGTYLKGVLPNSIRTIRKDHKGHEDRGYFAEGNEGNEGGFGLGLVYRSTTLRLLC
jgi:hypothetical protein